MNNLSLFFFLLLFFLIFVFLENFTKKNKIEKLTFGNYHIKQFSIIGKGKNDFYIYGDILIDKKDKIFIQPFNLLYYTNGSKISIRSDKGIYIKKLGSYRRNISLFSGKKRKNLIRRIGVLQLIGNVKVNYKGIDMFTNFLIVDTKNGIAETFSKTIFVSKFSKTVGNRAIIDISNEKIIIYNVKSFYYNK